MTDTELFLEYQNTKNIELRNKIALNNFGLIPLVIKKIYIKDYHDYEELQQECFYWLLKAVETFNPTLGYKFSTYAYSQILQASRHRLDYNKDVSLDTPLTDSEDSENISLIDTIEDENINIEETTEYKHISDRLRILLNDREYTILRMHFRFGYDFAEIADKTNISINVIYNIKRRAINKIYTDPYFLDYRQEMMREKEISYLGAYDYTKPRVQTSEINSPVWHTLLQLEKADNDIYRKAFR